MGFTLTPQFNDFDRDSRHKVIRQYLGSGRGDGLRGIAIDLIKIYPGELLEEFKLLGVMRDIRGAAKKRDGGLPFAGPTAQLASDGSPIWRARQYWLFEDYCRNYTESMNQAAANLAIAEKYSKECEERYHRKPVIVQQDNLAQ
ncbi:MAG: hypothetical protein WB676_06995 [Bryobacteraceae bacterium]